MPLKTETCSIVEYNDFDSKIYVNISELRFAYVWLKFSLTYPCMS